MKRKQVNPKLLPNYFKKISFGLMAFSILMYALNRGAILDFDKELVKEIIKVGVLISLTMLALAKDKEEDELTIKIRTNSFAVSFLFGVFYLAIQPFSNLITDNLFFFDLSAYELILSMLFTYFMLFSLYKKSR